MPLEKILVAVDFSDESHNAVREAVEIARRTGARLTLLHVGAMPEQPIGVPASMHSTVAEYLRLLEQELARDRERLEELRERIARQGVEVAQIVIDGIPDQGIRVAADELGADLIVMGTHGRTGIKRFFLGSVAERVVRLSAKNVLVVRGQPRADGGFKNIAVATDLGDMADPVLAMALELAAPGAAIHVLHCWYLPPLSYPAVAPSRSSRELVTSLRESIVAGTAQLGEELIARHPREGVTIELHQREQVPAPGIQRWLDDHPECELVITGSHGRRQPARLLLGSVAEFTVRHAPCSVLVVHAGGAPAEESAPRD